MYCGLRTTVTRTVTRTLVVLHTRCAGVAAAAVVTVVAAVVVVVTVSTAAAAAVIVTLI
jgi:hypothetical protein